MVRIKHRYLLINILFPDSPLTNKTTPSNATPPAYVTFRSPIPSQLNPGLFISHLRNSIATHFGDSGLGLTTGSLKVVYLSPATSTAIVRCPRQHYRIVWAALTYINELPGVRRGVPGKQCVVQVVGVSGTIRKSEEELLRRARKDLVRAKAEEQGAEADVLGRVLGGSGNATAAPVVESQAYESIEAPDEDEDLEEESE